MKCHKCDFIHLGIYKCSRKINVSHRILTNLFSGIIYALSSTKGCRRRKRHQWWEAHIHRRRRFILWRNSELQLRLELHFHFPGHLLSPAVFFLLNTASLFFLDVPEGYLLPSDVSPVRLFCK